MSLRNLFFINLLFTNTILFCCLAPTNVQAQANDTFYINGHVTDLGGKGLDACILSILSITDSTVIAYGITDDQGEFSIKFVTADQQVLVRMTGFNVKQQVRQINSKNQTVDFHAEIENIVLKEVQVKARKLWGSRDTLNYLVSAYIKDHDRTIGDILTQLPGITIEDDIIKYQGTPINHFYIENLDVLQGRYSIATEGLKANDVATVQVLENHESRRALQDQSTTEAAAINLKLKDNAKGKWINSLKLSMGYDDDILWENEMNFMYFGKQRQHVLFYGNDNTGTNNDRSTQHYDRSGLGTTELVGIITPSASPIGKTLHNNKHTINISNLWKLEDTKQLRYNLNYSHDIQRRSCYSETSYLLPNTDMRVLSEDISARHTTNDATMQLQYENNAEKEYLENTLNLQGHWCEDNGTVASNDATINQHVYNRNLGLSNCTYWTHRTKNGKGFNLRSINTIQTTPQALSVNCDMKARQEIDLTRVSTTNHFSLINSFQHHYWTIDPTVDMNTNFVNIHSILQNELIVSSKQGNMNYFYTEGIIGILLKYVKKRLHFTLNMPLSLSYTNIENINDTRILLVPSLSLLWKANDHWTFNCNGSYNANQTSWNKLLTSYIMSNYHTINRYSADLNLTHSASLNGKINFKDIFNEFFAYTSVLVSQTWSNIIYGTTINDNGYTTLQAERHPNHTNKYSLTANASKGFNWHNSRLEATICYNRTNSQILRQSIATNYHEDFYSVYGNTTTDVFSRLRLSYNCTWTLARSVFSDYRYIVRTFNQDIRLNFYLVKNRLFFNVSGTHTHNSGFNGKKNYTFMDAGITFRTNKRKDEYRLSFDNIFNTRTFVSRTNSELTEYFTIYHLRPRSIMFSTKLTL